MSSAEMSFYKSREASVILHSSIRALNDIQFSPKRKWPVFSAMNARVPSSSLEWSIKG